MEIYIIFQFDYILNFSQNAQSYKSCTWLVILEETGRNSTSPPPRSAYLPQIKNLFNKENKYTKIKLRTHHCNKR